LLPVGMMNTSPPSTSSWVGEREPGSYSTKLPREVLDAGARLLQQLVPQLEHALLLARLQHAARLQAGTRAAAKASQSRLQRRRGRGPLGDAAGGSSGLARAAARGGGTGAQGPGARGSAATRSAADATPKLAQQMRVRGARDGDVAHSVAARLPSGQPALPLQGRRGRDTPPPPS
jgi:hypothetical protein